jgi:hypothetical protein
VPTIADNIRTMAELVADVKKQYRLSETSILRIVDMNFAIAQQNNSQSFSGEEDIPDFPEDAIHAPDETIPEGQLVLFPETPADIEAVEEDGDEAVIAAVVPQED